MKADSRTVSYQLDAADLETRGQLQQLQFCRHDSAIVLDDMLLIEDDAPAIGRPEGAQDRSWFENLHRGVMIRKDLVLDDARAFAAYLLFDGMEKDDNEHPLHIRVNGHHVLRPPTKLAHPFARHYYTSDWAPSHFDNWFVVPVPAGALRQGTNEFVLWAESEETSWEIMVAADSEYSRGSESRLHHPDRSAKSRDGGVTWDFEHLGWKDEIDGEYVVRLSLDRRVPRGTYISPAIDLASAGANEIVERLQVEETTVTWEVDAPTDTEIEISARVGTSPLPSADSWSEFEPVSGFSLSRTAPPGRYLQFRAAMRARNPLVTPALRGVSVITRLAPPSPATHEFRRIHGFDNGRVVRPSVEYVHEDFSRLAPMRRRFELDALVDGAATEFEAQLRLMNWAYRVPIDRLNPYSWSYDDLPQLKAGEDGHPLLLGPYDVPRRQGHCLFCNLTLIAACLSMGYPSRWVNISTKHTYGHEVAEIWSNDFDKWVFMDATLDYYLYDPDTGVPMNLVEANERLAEIMPAPATWDFPMQWQMPDESTAARARVAYRQGDNTHPIDDPAVGPSHLILKGHLQTPLRMDFASRPHPVPWRLTSNWGSDIFYCHYADMFPRKREYQHHTSRRQDFNPPLNQAELFISETEDPLTLRVEIDTETPCFENFAVQLDDGEWQSIPGPGLEWRLHEGLNRLRARTRNSMGRCGPESCVTVVMNS